MDWLGLQEGKEQAQYTLLNQHCKTFGSTIEKIKISTSCKEPMLIEQAGELYWSLFKQYFMIPNYKEHELH